MEGFGKTTHTELQGIWSMLAMRANKQGQINSIPQVRVSGVAFHLNDMRENKEVNMLKDFKIPVGGWFLELGIMQGVFYATF